MGRATETVGVATIVLVGGAMECWGTTGGVWGCPVIAYSPPYCKTGLGFTEGMDWRIKPGAPIKKDQVDDVKAS